MEVERHVGTQGVK
jgi:hypothetical protein